MTDAPHAPITSDEAKAAFVILDKSGIRGSLRYLMLDECIKRAEVSAEIIAALTEIADALGCEFHPRIENSNHR